MYEYYVVEVMRVVDGDTVDLRIDLGFHLTAALRFRLLGVDTPERGKPGFREATEFTREWLAARDWLAARTVKTDSFGRWLAEVYDVDTGDNLALSLIVAGMGAPYRT